MLPEVALPQGSELLGGSTVRAAGLVERAVCTVTPLSITNFRFIGAGADRRAGGVGLQAVDHEDDHGGVGGIGAGPSLAAAAAGRRRRCHRGAAAAGAAARVPPRRAPPMEPPLPPALPPAPPLPPLPPAAPPVVRRCRRRCRPRRRRWRCCRRARRCCRPLPRATGAAAAACRPCRRLPAITASARAQPSATVGCTRNACHAVTSCIGPCWARSRPRPSGGRTPAVPPRSTSSFLK